MKPPASPSHSESLSSTRRCSPWLCLVFATCWIAPALADEPLVVVTPESVDMSSQALERLTSTMRGYVDRQELAGLATLIARRGQVVHFETYGVSDLESGHPTQPDTIYRIYSMTKPITSVAALLLLEEGRYKLDDHVADFIPTFKTLHVYDPDAPDGSKRAPLARPVTIQHLLTHTSGLTYGYSAATPVDALYQQAKILDRAGTLEDMIQKLNHLPLVHQPGTRWHYGISTEVLGYLVEVVSGQPLDKFCEDRIFKPLRMPDTGFAVPPQKEARFAAIYAKEENGRLKPWGGSVETTTYLAPVRFFSGGGGAVSTLPDYLRFAQMLLHGGELDGTRLLSRESVRLMTTNHLEGEFRPGWGFGFGVQVCTDVARTNASGSEGSFSWGGGGNTFFFVDPKQELVAMVWTQLSGMSPISREFREAVYQSLIDPEQQVESEPSNGPQNH